MILHIIFRLVIWFLLTANFSVANSIMGFCIALLLPRGHTEPERLKDWLRVLGELLVAIPQAYIEAIEIMFRPHNYETVTMEHVKPERSTWLIFLDIFLITFTPKTIVLKYHQDGFYEVHKIKRRGT